MDPNGMLFDAKGHGRQRNSKQKRGEDRRRTQPVSVGLTIGPLIQEGVSV